MKHTHEDIATQFLGLPFEKLDQRTQEIARRIAQRQHIAIDTAEHYDQKMTRGQRAADKLASFGGSWQFIGIFAAALFAWVLLNSVVLTRYDKAFDPYPYILLNLFLSMLASIQAPIILMSQNRQAQKDRLNAAHDYEVNLKADLEIMLLHQKLDLLREQQWEKLLEIQQQQLDLLTGLAEQKTSR